MIGTGIDVRVKIQDIVSSQLPSYIRSEAPLTDEFLKQFYVSQEMQGGPVDIATNLDQYLDLNNLSSESIYGEFELTQDISAEDTVVYVNTTKSFPNEWGLLKVDDEIMTYTGVTTNTFTGVVRGFSGVSQYNVEGTGGALVFETTSAANHKKEAEVQNLSTLFLKEFYNKIKSTFAPGFENLDVDSDLSVGNWIRQVRAFFQTKGSEESIEILFKVLYGEDPTVIDLEKFLIKPSEAEYSRRDYAVCLPVEGNPIELKGRTIFQSNSPDVFGAVSEIEAFTRDNRLYYRLNYFVSNDEISNERKLFTIPGRTFCHREWKNGDTTITVDTTLGFRDNGQFITADGTIFNYQQKTVNQFLGVTCSDPDKIVSVREEILDDITVEGVSETGERIVLRVTGVNSDIDFDGDVPFSFVGEKIRVDTLGENILSNVATRDELTIPQIIANSFIYNTSVRFEVKEVNGTEFILSAPYLDKSSINVGDSVDFLQRGSQVVYASNRTVTDIDFQNSRVTVDDSFGIPVDQLLDIRRVQKYANSTETPIDYGNDAVLSNVLNVYDATRYDSNFYVATNSLPSYEITASIVESSIVNPVLANFEDFNSFTNLYSTLVFDREVEFYTGDLITYTFTGDDAEAITSPGEYYVEVLSDRRKIKLYLSPSFIGSVNFVGLTPTEEPGNHFFTLESQNTREISTKRIFRKIPALDTLESVGRGSQPTEPGVIAVLTNGVEIISYKSPNKVYLGPIRQINAAAGGEGYSVTSPPDISIEEPNVQITDGSPPPVTPTVAKASAVIKGRLERILIDPQDFDIDEVFSITVTGGNSPGASAKPIIERKRRTIPFDTRLTDIGGGVNFIEDSILFQVDHKLPLGEPIVYNNRGFESIGVSAADNINISTGGRLANGGTYFAKPINSRTIQLFDSLSELENGGDPVNLSENLNGFGVQSFETFSKNRVTGATIIEDGGDFYYRNMKFSPENVFTEYDEIRYNEHGFNNGDIVEYGTTGTAISGLSTENQYLVFKVDNNTLKLSDAGIGGTITSNFERLDFVSFNSAGVGTHNIKYPDITAKVSVSFASSITGEVVATPVIRGEINQVYVEDGGYYGSDIIDFQKNPKVEPVIGFGARIRPVVVDGAVVSVQILSRGRFYSDTPDIRVIDRTGAGAGAVLRAIVVDGEIFDIIIINQGLNYDANNTDIEVVEPAKDSILIPRIRDLTINLQSRFGFEVLSENNYRVVSYDRTIRQGVYNDDGNVHSPIIGWANDGNPIYGGFGLSDPNDINSGFRAMKTAYDLDPGSVYGRPSQITYPAGFFVDDFKYTDQGDLDEYNGRYCRTPEFPHGVYAYFAGISVDTLSQAREPQFPYFIGDSFRDSPIDESTNVDQSFDLQDKKIYRNTFPYYVGSPVAGSEFFDQSYLLDNQETVITATNPGFIERIDVVGVGQSYRVGDIPLFDSTQDTINTVVSEIVGRDVVGIEQQKLSYSKLQTKVIRLDDKTLRIYVEPFHDYLENDSVIISGLSTELSAVNGTSIIKLDNSGMTLYSPVLPTNFGGITEDVFVNRISENVSVDSEIKIGNGDQSERVQVLNIFPINKALRVFRPTGYGQTNFIGTAVNVVPDFFDIDAKTDTFTSNLNESYYFNPRQTIGIGLEDGVTVDREFKIGNIEYNISVPTRSIYANNHGFVHLEEVVFSKPDGAPVIRANDGVNPAISIPGSGDEQTLFVSNISRDYIGLKTSVNGPDLFFETDGPLSGTEFRYNIRTNRFAESANLDRIKAKVTTDTPHGLENKDSIRAEVVPFGPSGIGSNASVYVQYDDVSESLIIDPKYVSPSGIDTSGNLVVINNHNFILGDYLLYESFGTPIVGLETHGKYFVIPFDSDRFYLAETSVDIKPGFEKPISLDSAGIGTHKFSKVNPQIRIVSNHDILFDLSDESLLDREFGFFLDQELTETFVSNSIDEEFSVSGVSTEGFPGGQKTIRYSENNKNVLYYGISKGGYISTSDTNAPQYNSIKYIDSSYTTKQKVTVDSDTEFTFSLSEIPEVSEYNLNNSSISYTTSSRNTFGGVGKVTILSSGKNFTSLPEFLTIQSAGGTNASLKAFSSDIGRVSSYKIQNPGWGYNADKTLSPAGKIQSTIEYSDSDFVTSIDVVDGGSGYQTAPNGVLVDSVTREEINNGSVNVEIQTSTIVNVEVEVAPSGLSKNSHEFYTVNNSNGIPILQIDDRSASAIGIVTFTIQTPLAGYFEKPFEVGDKVFIENILSATSDNVTNLSSPEIGYRFLDVVDVLEVNPIIMTVQYPEDVYPNVGAAATFQGAFSSIVNKKIYPTFSVEQATATFIIGERLSLVEDDGRSQETDLIVEESNTNFFKVRGNFDILVGDSLRGSISGVVVTVTKITGASCKFIVDSVSRIESGWNDEIGFINEEFQVTPDNDYYQNLSYSIKSKVNFEDLIGPVNRLVHPSGLKNFADTKIESSGKVGFATTAVSTESTITLDFIGLTDVADTPLRVDRINIFDLGYDDNVNNNKSNAIRFNSKTPNKRLTDFIEVRTNRVLMVDDISNQFIDADNVRNQTPYIIYPVVTDSYTRGLLQVRNPFTDEVQLTEIIALTVGNNAFTMQKAEVFDGESSKGEFSAFALDSSEYELRFTPSNLDTFDVDSKLLTHKLGGSGTGSAEIGYVTLDGDRTSLLANQSQRIYTAPSNLIQSMVLHAFVLDASSTPYYYEIYVFVLNNIAYYSVYNFDGTKISNYSDPIAELTADYVGGRIVIDINNNSNKTILVETKTIEFTSAFSGESPYRFKARNIQDGEERGLNLLSDKASGSTNDTRILVSTQDVELFQSKKVVASIMGANIAAIHQVMVANSNAQTYTNVYPFITEGESVEGAGIGTFGSEISGNDWQLWFYPDASLPTEPLEIITYSESFYREYDNINYTSTPLVYDKNEEQYFLRQYVAPLGERTNKTRFELLHQGVPIFEKQFFPADVMDFGGNYFAINDHFFSPAEELYYEFSDSIDPSRAEPIQIAPVTDYLGVTTTTMPSKVWAVKLDLVRFGVAATKQDAIDLNLIEFVGVGSGNLHTFGMQKKIQKGLFTIDGVVQSPLASANIVYNLDTSVDADEEILNLAGIGTISAGDLLLVNDEYLLIEDVGFGDNPSGPITNVGQIPLIRVERGVVGSSATSHSAGSSMDLYRGNYNIVDSDIVFTEAPNGRGDQTINENNLVELNSTFQGRVFLQQNYDDIAVYDDLSDQFDGIQNRFDITLSGLNTRGVENGGGVLIINDIYQTPTTENNQGNNYFFTDAAQTFNFIWSNNTDAANPDVGEFRFTLGETEMGFADVDANGINRETYWSTLRVGARYVVTANFGNDELFQYEGENTDPLGPNPEIRLTNGGLISGTLPSSLLIGSQINLTVTPVDPQTQVIFTGITSSNGQRVESEFDINQNQIPRGGLIVSLGSTPGLGYAPLYDAVLEPEVVGGVIVGVFTGNNIGTTTQVRWADYNNENGELVIAAYGPSVTGTIAVSDAQYFAESGRLVITSPTSLTGLGVSVADIVDLNGLEFTCPGGSGITTTLFPDKRTTFVVESLISDTIFSTIVGISTIDHTYVSGGTFEIVESFQFGREGTNPDFVYLDGLEFACPTGETVGLTTTLFPVGTNNFPVIQKDNNALIRLQVGVSTINHVYVGGGTIGQITKNSVGSGYNGPVSIAVTETGHTGRAASIRGIPGPGGELQIVIDDGGSGYTDPYISAPSPTYFNLPVKGVFRRGVGETEATGKNLFITCEVGGSKTTAIGRSEYFEVTGFDITNQGYGFQEGDIITAVGLVTDKRLSEPLEEFQLTVERVFTDNFSYWNYGEQDYIDSIKNLQDGVRTRFPLFYNGQQFSFEQNAGDEDSSAVDLSAILLIYVNTVLQAPGLNYTFTGGTSFDFTKAPQPEDDIDIYFYRGKRRLDSIIVTDVDESIRPGDELQIRKNDAIDKSRTQDIRTVTEIAASDTVRTNIYFGTDDIDTQKPRPVAWDKQKRDIFIYGQPTFKSRDSLEPQIRPTAAILQPVNPQVLTNELFIDNPLLFQYEAELGSSNAITNISAKIYGQSNILNDWDLVTGGPEFRPAVATAIVNASGEVTGVSFSDRGRGYPQSTTAVIAPPIDGTRAFFTNFTIDTFDGSVDRAETGFGTGRGSGYDPNNPPYVIIDQPPLRYEDGVTIQESNVEGYVGNIIGIEGFNEVGVDKIRFRFEKTYPSSILISTLKVNDFIVVNQTFVGNGIRGISGNNPNAVIGIGTQFLDCVYRVSAVNFISERIGEFVVNVDRDVSSINITGDLLGNFSWGRISGVQREFDNIQRFLIYSPVYTENMENFPTLVRTSAGLRDRGPIAKRL